MEEREKTQYFAVIEIEYAISDLTPPASDPRTKERGL